VPTGGDSGTHTINVAWSVLGKLRDLDRSVAMDMVLASVYLMAGDQWGRLVNLAERQDHQAVGEMIAAAWDEGPGVPGWVRSVRLADRVGHPLQFAATKIVLELDGAARREAKSDRTSTADVFDLLVAKFADGEYPPASVPTPPTVVQAMVAMLAPEQGEAVYDPWCRAGELLIGAAEAVRKQTGNPLGSRVAGQALDSRSRVISSMNLRLHGIDADLGGHAANALHDDIHAEDRFDLVLTNPPFNQSWEPEYFDGSRRIYAVPAAHNANFAWLQHSLAKLNRDGRMGILLPNNAGVSEGPADRAVRTGLLHDDLIDCMIALPPHLFPGTAIPVTMWLLDRRRNDRSGQVLFIDAAGAGVMVQRTRRELEPSDVERITGVYRTWRNGDGVWEPGAVVVPVNRILSKGAILNPRAYVGGADDEARSRAEISQLESYRDELGRLGRRATELDDEIDRKLAGLRWEA
jgi:type I restriction enzyme M protein